MTEAHDAAVAPIDKLRRNLARVSERVAAACTRAGRDPRSVRLVAVTKLVAPDIIRLLPQLGLVDVGENRVQSALEKQRLLAGASIQWHLIGSLQKNKAKKAALAFPWIHSVDSLELGDLLSQAAVAAGRTSNALLQVNVAREPQKSGVAPEAVPELLRALRSLPGLRVKGLMTIGPLSEDVETLRPVFRALRRLLPADDAECRELSMGMSNDFEVAIEEGASMIRLGHALFEGLMDENP